MNDFRNYHIGVVYRNIPRADPIVISKLSGHGVSAISESMGRMGLMQPYIRPIDNGLYLCGSAVTVLLNPGDNWMMHVVAEQIQKGDVVVVGLTADCTDGYFGDLLATSFRARGAIGLVIDAGVRDVSELRKMKFPVWSKSISARGPIKAALGSVNIPVVCGGTLVTPGDIVVADDDGVVIVPLSILAQTIKKTRQRESNEEEKRAKLSSGTLGIDMYKMREGLEKSGLKYVD